MLPRPQPIGIFPFPAGLLLLPSTDDARASETRRQLMLGAVPDEWPDAWRFFGQALEGNREGALASLPAAPHDAVAAYNRFVLSGDEASLALARGAHDATLRALAETAAYVQGATDQAATLDSLEGQGEDEGELAAVVRLAWGAWHLERGESALAQVQLAHGVQAARAASPLLAAQLQSQRAQVLGDGGGTSADALAAWRDAVQLANGARLPNLRCDLLLGLALALHDAAGSARQLLVEAINTYQEALHAGITLEGRPETYALVQNNLGLAYIAMPMTSAGDKIRLAVAVQAFREALKVYTREAFPDQWSSATLNMANALQYLPSSHPQENLIEAVNAYEALLEVRNRALDPVGYARLLANQANALAHLGMFGPSVEKLTEARKLLSWHGEDDSAAALLEQVERINAQMAATAGAAGAS
jgi:tetratricopeptide (TPR) repeat protein